MRKIRKKNRNPKKNHKERKNDERGKNDGKCTQELITPDLAISQPDKRPTNPSCEGGTKTRSCFSGWVLIGVWGELWGRGRLLGGTITGETGSGEHLPEYHRGTELAEKNFRRPTTKKKSRASKAKQRHGTKKREWLKEPREAQTTEISERLEKGRKRRV